ncbi:MAG: 30S ribosomal protein S16, partial [Armatimonadetes bacterium]|nr:30S ribosomal protein S16 [Anaerolineae bacterium]
MIRIRFQRVGLKGQPSYRIVVSDQRRARNGSDIEVIGFHNPRTRPSTDEIKFDRVLYWLSKGAQPSDAAHNMLTRVGIMAMADRARKGESLEVLAAEAEAKKAALPPVSPKTKFAAPTTKAQPV